VRPKAEHNPNPSASWVKDTLVEDYVATARRNGSSASSAAIERLAAHDLTIHEAVQREQRRQPQRTRAPKPKGPAVKNVDGGVLWKSAQARPAGGDRRRVAAVMGQRPANEKQAAAIARLGAILQPRSWFRPSKEFDYRMPQLAKDFVQVVRQLESATGDFEGKSARDCRRVFWRKVEDICDKSTGVLGPWWVK